MKRRLFAWLLVCLMLVGTISVPVHAEDDADPGSSQSDTDGNTGGESGGNTGGESGGSTGGNTGGESGGNTGGEGSGSTGGNTGGEGSGSTGGNTGGEGSGSTGGNTGGEGSGSTGGNTGGEGSGSTGGNTGGEGSGNTGGQTCTHTFGSWTASADKHTRTCSKCGKSEEAAHLMEGGTITVAPTCTAEGSVTYTCTACGYSKTEAMAKLAHTLSYACDDRCDICDAVVEAKHTPNAAWSKNSSGHWHACTVCGKKIDEADHYPGPAATEEKDQICLTCGYIMTPKKTHTHKYETKYTADNTGHWYACSGCEEKKDFAVHDFENACGGICKTCGYEAEMRHDYGGVWSSDETGHWLTCVVCGVEEEYEAHIPGAEADEFNPQQCITCFYELAPKVGAEETTAPEAALWESDDTYHWQANPDGSQSQQALHTWDNGKDRWDGQVVYTCTVCQAKRVGEHPAGDDAVTAPEEKGFPWAAVLLVVLVILFIGATATLVFLLRKPSGGKFNTSPSSAEKKATAKRPPAKKPVVPAKKREERDYEELDAFLQNASEEDLDEEEDPDEYDWDAYIDSL